MNFSIDRPPDGTVRLLEKNDLDFNKSFIGWIPNSQGVGRHNPRGFAQLWIVIKKDGKDLYEQPIFIENPGSIVVCQAGEKIAMVQNFRMISERILNAGANYIHRLDSEQFWDKLVTKLGEWRWELPRGIAPIESDYGGDMTDFILKTAKLELLEESGLYLKDAKIVSQINVNSTFFAHAQFVVHGILDSTGQRKPEDTEMIGDTRFFSAEEVRKMVNCGLLNDGPTKAALADCAFHY